MKMRILAEIGTGILMALLLSGCAREKGNTLLEGAAPETCSLSWYTYELQESYDLKVYGEFPAGQYRLEKEGLTAEFEIRE